MGFFSRLREDKRRIERMKNAPLASRSFRRKRELSPAEWETSPQENRTPSYSSGLSRSEEVIIAVMGITGSGKTSFIKNVTGYDIDIGDGLFSDTAEITGYRFSYEGIKYLLVDTPGFNDTFINNKSVTEKILAWLEAVSGAGSRLNGIIIIHDISKRRLEGSATSKNLRFFRQLMHGDPCLSVTLATSFWDTVTEFQGERRERELMESKAFWADMVAKGSDVVRIWPDSDICRQVLKLAGEKATLAQSASDAPVDLAYRLRAAEAEEGAKIQEYKAELQRKKELEQEAFRRQLEERQLAHQREMSMRRAQAEEELREQARLAREAERRALRRDEEERQRRKQVKAEWLREQERRCEAQEARMRLEAEAIRKLEEKKEKMLHDQEKEDTHQRRCQEEEEDEDEGEEAMLKAQRQKKAERAKKGAHIVSWLLGEGYSIRYIQANITFLMTNVPSHLRVPKWYILELLALEG